MKSKKALLAITLLLALSLALLTGCDPTPDSSSGTQGSPASSEAQSVASQGGSPSASGGTTSSGSMVVVPQSEHQRFYDYFLSRWTLYNPFSRTYTEDTFSDDFSPYFLYAGCIMQESAQPNFTGDYRLTGDIPADYVEQTVIWHFPITAEQYRASLPMTPDAYEYYDPAQNTYHFPGGYGGREMRGTVTEVLQEGNCYYISCDWFNDEGNFEYSHTVTVVLGEIDLDFYYRENTRTG